MSDVNKEVKQEETNSLAPIPEKDRIMGWGSNTMLWLGGCISIGTLAMGSAQMEAGLNLLQLFLAVAIGSMILVVGIAMNDQFSYKTGAPYAVQLRSAFGTKGNKIPSLIRGLPAIVWYGYQTWLGGAAINNISKALFGYYLVILHFIPDYPDPVINQRIPRCKMGWKYRRSCYFSGYDLPVIPLHYTVWRCCK